MRMISGLLYGWLVVLLGGMLSLIGLGLLYTSIGMRSLSRIAVSHGNRLLFASLRGSPESLQARQQQR